MWPWGACWLRTLGERQAGPRLEEAMDLALGQLVPARLGVPYAFAEF